MRPWRVILCGFVLVQSRGTLLRKYMLGLSIHIFSGAYSGGGPAGPAPPPPKLFYFIFLKSFLNSFLNIKKNSLNIFKNIF